MGTLSGIKVIELTGLGPGPFCAMMLGDMGADVVRIDRIGGHPSTLDARKNILDRSRRSVGINLKSTDGIATALRLIDQADALVEGFRPGVMERLGLGPDICLARNPRLVYGRVTGWGQCGRWPRPRVTISTILALLAPSLRSDRKRVAPYPRSI